jgi:hypothetical protein
VVTVPDKTIFCDMAEKDSSTKNRKINCLINFSF